MISQKVHAYYFFGTCVRYIQDAKEGVLLGGPAKVGGWYIRANLEVFFKHLEEYGLVITIRASHELREGYDELSIKPPEHRLTAPEAARLSTSMTTLRHTLDAELEGLSAYIVTPKRLDSSKLLNEVAALLSPGVFEKLPSIAQYDLSEAGKCIAFERSTAGAFHILRATEAVLRVFYVALVKRGRGSLMWGPILADLRRRRAGKAHGVLIANLDNIRMSFRNPTQHPDATYDTHEVQDLWALCGDAISRMAKILK